MQRMASDLLCIALADAKKGIALSGVAAVSRATQRCRWPVEAARAQSDQNESSAFSPVIPAKAGIQCLALGPRLRGDDGRCLRPIGSALGEQRPEAREEAAAA